MKLKISLFTSLVSLLVLFFLLPQSASLKDTIKEAKIHADVFGSDHCPVSVMVEV
jgi:hypothetical protein